MGKGSMSKLLSDVGSLYITIDDVNEPPVLRDAIYSTYESFRGEDEKMVSNYDLQYPGTPMKDYASDIDDFGQFKQTWGHPSLTYTIEMTCGDCIKTMFIIDSKRGQILHAPVYKERGEQGVWRSLDYEVKKSYSIIVRATDGPGPEDVSGRKLHKAKSQGIDDTATVVVHINDVNENPI